MKVHFFDDTPAKPGEKHGSLGPTHCGSVSVDYEYQADMWVDEVRDLNSSVVKAELHVGDEVIKRWEYSNGTWNIV